MRLLIILSHALIGWGLCGAVMGLGLAFTSVETALIIHLLAAPIIFSLISLLYFRKFSYTSPLSTAAIFVGTIILMDFFVVSLLIEKSFEMFLSPMGTWVPFLLIFLATYGTGKILSLSGRILK